MPPFRFKLEQVRIYRRQLEEEAMQVLAGAVTQRDSLKARLESLQRELGEQGLRLSRVESLSGAERGLALDYCAALRHDLTHCRQRLAEAENEVDRCRAEVLLKAKDRGLLDSLKKKQAERHQLLERQQERKINDETATLRYKPAAL